jgi:hypothetical protein
MSSPFEVVSMSSLDITPAAFAHDGLQANVEGLNFRSDNHEVRISKSPTFRIFSILHMLAR